MRPRTRIPSKKVTEQAAWAAAATQPFTPTLVPTTVAAEEEEELNQEDTTIEDTQVNS